MNSIRNRIISWLGGYTLEELKESNYNSYNIGRLSAFNSVKRHMDSMYGIAAEEWCKSTYEYVEKNIYDLSDL